LDEVVDVLATKLTLTVAVPEATLTPVMVAPALTAKSAALRVSPAAPVKVTALPVSDAAALTAGPAVSVTRVSVTMAAAWVMVTVPLPLIFVLPDAIDTV
jgi:hypothetical protein